MAFTIAIAGKGGTGKTTLAALTIKELVRAGKKPVLAVDADANANLHEALGMPRPESIAEITHQINNNLQPLPAGMTKDQYLAFRVHQALAEGDDTDLLVMGGPEGPGCYCYVNNLLRGFIEELSKNYPYLVMDNEAGLEHLSRRTTQNVDVFFITSDASARGVRSAGRIKELADSLNLGIKKMYLVLTKTVNGTLPALKEEVERTGLVLAGEVPLDEEVYRHDLEGRPLVNLPENSPAVNAVRDIMHKVGIL